MTIKWKPSDVDKAFMEVRGGQQVASGLSGVFEALKRRISGGGNGQGRETRIPPRQR